MKRYQNHKKQGMLMCTPCHSSFAGGLQEAMLNEDVKFSWCLGAVAVKRFTSSR
jgi:hypothetical protein